MAKKQSNWNLSRIIREVLLLVATIFVVTNIISYFRAPALDSDKIPDIQATLINGKVFDISQYKNKPVLINFWGTWCPVCKQEASNIEVVSKRYTVLTIAVNSGVDEEIRQWMQEKGVSYPVLNDKSGAWASKFKVSVFPTNFIYDSKGKLKFTETGYSTTAGLLARMKLAE
ncbi:MAG: redoxin domain-containing protein [Sulfurovum sp.]|nr:redoxin domain-containing protein [Sulfurovum sp.]